MISKFVKQIFKLYRGSVMVTHSVNDNVLMFEQLLFERFHPSPSKLNADKKHSDKELGMSSLYIPQLCLILRLHFQRGILE